MNHSLVAGPNMFNSMTNELLDNIVSSNGMDLPHKDHFGDNVYVRELPVPANTILVGRVHKVDHVFILASGKTTMWSEATGSITITGPKIIESKAGTRRIFYTYTNIVMITSHGLNGIYQSYDNSDDKLMDVLTCAKYEDYIGLKQNNTLLLKG